MPTASTSRALAIAGTLMLVSLPAHALRCGTDIVDEDDLMFEVEQACGPPLSRQVIGYVDSLVYGDRIRVMNIEEWIYKINRNHYSLEFEGNRLQRITRIR
ncbi:MAG TPA: hypothetical protein DEP32_12370 [Pseudomonas sp.]|jgi:hypothetical protein|uniref:DUF2845 domain-containing protein n=1 Tax=Halopseudomonas pachastrellae TaxID=254161 RepID=UPI000C637516|nr:hypothetical protein [Pseudomonadales bacterium]MAQ49941.1 hypothetical protein [Pseudomonas sp.]MEB3734112.1 DUF2845 domain-containing protein [Halopseudomonas pachastrellae]MED5493726.1 DUF2845 domain-containing protein [Pseudomonadota bacterium]MBB51399.1 hypothetical protein [Pseudomonadales bacterium]|tara:strand:+ start:212 stop:514 length:303 start_codon:yes stop_codon:yes gene_type:complete